MMTQKALDKAGLLYIAKGMISKRNTECCSGGFER